MNFSQGPVFSIFKNLILCSEQSEGEHLLILRKSQIQKRTITRKMPKKQNTFFSFDYF